MLVAAIDYGQCGVFGLSRTACIPAAFNVELRGASMPVCEAVVRRTVRPCANLDRLVLTIQGRDVEGVL
jgi:hypothetical protein